jgi:hypothetical protein
MAIPEIEILIASSLWLWRNQALPAQFSIASGQGIDAQANQDRLVKALEVAGVPSILRSFVSWGPDIIALSAKRYWQVECKGAGVGKQSTQRNNFDRAVASIVSYYRDSAPKEIPELAAAEPALALAVPATPGYLALLRSRVPLALRKRLNLWILLYGPSSSAITPVEPSTSLP